MKGLIFFNILLIGTLLAYNNCQPQSSSSNSAGSTPNTLSDSNQLKNVSYTVNLLINQQIANTLDLNANADFTFDPGTMNARLSTEGTKGLIKADFLLDGKVNLVYTPPLDFSGEDHASVVVADKLSNSPLMEVAVLLKVNSSDSNKLLISGINQIGSGHWGYVEIKKIGSIDFVNQPTKIVVSSLVNYHSISTSENLNISDSLIGYGIFKEQQFGLANVDPETVNSLETIEIAGDNTYYYYFTLLKSGSAQLLFNLADPKNSISLGSHSIYVSAYSSLEIVSNLIVGPETVTANQCAGPFRIINEYQYSEKFNTIKVNGAQYYNYLFEESTCVKEMPVGIDTKSQTKTYSPRYSQFYAKLAADQFGTKVVFSSLPSKIIFSNCVNLDGSDAIKLYFNLGTSPGTKEFTYSADGSNYMKVPDASVKSNYIDLTYLYSSNLASKIYYFKLINSIGTKKSTPLIVRVRTADLSGSSILPGSCSVQ
jgi:hypothetical protein